MIITVSAFELQLSRTSNTKPSKSQAVHTTPVPVIAALSTRTEKAPKKKKKSGTENCIFPPFDIPCPTPRLARSPRLSKRKPGEKPVSQKRHFLIVRLPLSHSTTFLHFQDLGRLGLHIITLGSELSGKPNQQRIERGQGRGRGRGGTLRSPPLTPQFRTCAGSGRKPSWPEMSCCYGEGGSREGDRRRDSERNISAV